MGKSYKPKFGRRGPNHGLSNTPEYSVWEGMIQRCTNPNSEGYPLYGAKGVEVTLAWRKFINFYSDMGPRPTSEHTLDRIDATGNYELSNCRWTTWNVQWSNRRPLTNLCKAGHLLEGNNLKLQLRGSGYTERRCKACDKKYLREYHQKRKALAHAAG